MTLGLEVTFNFHLNVFENFSLHLTPHALMITSNHYNVG